MSTHLKNASLLLLCQTSWDSLFGTWTLAPWLVHLSHNCSVRNVNFILLLF